MINIKCVYTSTAHEPEFDEQLGEYKRRGHEGTYMYYPPMGVETSLSSVPDSHRTDSLFPATVWLREAT